MSVLNAAGLDLRLLSALGGSSADDIAAADRLIAGIRAAAEAAAAARPAGAD